MPDGRCDAEAVLFHLGHDLKLGHIRFSESDKAYMDGENEKMIGNYRFL
jgi:hypothetical protein